MILKLRPAGCMWALPFLSGQVKLIPGVRNGRIRPLTYVADDGQDLEPLTPAMFLQNIREVDVPELDQIDENKLNKILVYRNRIQNDLRKRFRIEYLAASPLVRLVEGEERWEASDHPQSVLPLNWDGIEPNRIVTCIVPKATDNDMRHLALGH
ncbi:uncharacterized protein TNCV_4495681 [Trichonephila clavipes]|nr:uncharacterized protein TNCV_4495681 [Trichonephila clavipes]